MTTRSRIRELEAQAAQLQARHAAVRPARQPYGAWLREVSPTWCWTWPHLLLLHEALERITTGQNRRLAVFKPPRHGKTEDATVRYPTYRLECDPELRTIVGAYNQTLAEKFSRKARRIARERIPLSRERTAAEDWETAAGGGLRAVGVGGGVTGQGANLIVIDDPVKSREEANSEAYRERVWEWYRDDLYTRLEPGGAIILIMTLWHSDDLAGRILESEEGAEWEVLRLPALAETQEERDRWCAKKHRPTGQPDPLGREPGAALCPQRFDEAALAGIRRVLGRSFEALYQQRPQPAEGSMFKRHWFKLTKQAPGPGKRVRFWDKAGTESGGARTAGGLVTRNAAGQIFVEHVVKFQSEAVGREASIKAQALLDGQKYGAGGLEIWVEQEPGSGGKESAEATIRNLAGLSVHADKVTGDKVTRAEPFAAQCEGGNVFLVEGDWNQAFIDEACDFPTGRFKDQVDAVSGAFNKLAGGYWTGETKW